MSRFLTFRFDDGLIAGAKQAIRLLEPWHATFFIVTGQVQGAAGCEGRTCQEPSFAGKQFGSISDWEKVVALGHDVQSHSVTHARFSSLALSEQRKELRDSLAAIRALHGEPYAFCFPYNDITAIDLRTEGFAAAGFVSRSSDEPVLFNPISASLDAFRLRSWMVRERHFDRVVSDLARVVPDDSWTILGLHSLDGEGHEPWTSAGFARLVGCVRTLGYSVSSVSEILARLKWTEPT